MDENSALREIPVSSESIFDGKILHVKKDTVRLPGGKTSTREFIRHVGAVCMVPVTEDGRVYVERQYRYPLDEIITEIPAGKLDSLSEDRLAAAKRELREETGLTGDEWIDMGDFHPTVGYSDERISMYLVRGLHAGEQDLDEGEFLHVKTVPLEELVEQVMNGTITDGKTQAAVLKAARLLGK